MTRQQKTARQRAEETLAVAERRVSNLDKQRKRLQGEINQVVNELDQAKARLDYAKQDPALRGSSTTSTANPTGATA